MSNIELSIVMPAYNHSELTIRCLGSLLENTSGTEYEVIVVDNESSDDTPEVLLEFKQKFNEKGIQFAIQTNTKNVGFGRAMNQGARAAQGKYVALVSNDTWAMKGWNTALIESIEKYKADMVSPYYYEGEFDSESLPKRAAEFVKRNKNRSTDEWGAMFMMFRTDSFKKIGMFDERFYVTYEDTDLRERCERAGMKHRLVGNCLIWHKVMGTRGKDANPSRFEVEGLKIFMDIWGFDPRPRGNTFMAKKIRSFRKFRRKYGIL